MSQSALLRSGKGLGIPGTARKTDRKTKLKVAAPAPVEDRYDERNDHFAVRKGVRCAGVHLIIDLHGAKRLDDIEHIEATLAPLRRGGARDAPAHPPAPFPAERRVRRGGAGGEPHLHPHLAGCRLCRARRIHVRVADPDACIPVLREAFAPSAWPSTRYCAAAAPEPTRRELSAGAAGPGPGRFFIRAAEPKNRPRTCHGREALDRRDVVRRPRLPHELPGGRKCSTRRRPSISTWCCSNRHSSARC